MRESKQTKQIQKWFNHYNHKFFEGKLPKCRFSYSRKLAEFKWIGECDYETLYIRLDEKLWRWKWTRVARMTLLHEMVHLKLGSTGHARVEHGPLFEKEMLRLAKVGAFKGLW